MTLSFGAISYAYTFAPSQLFSLLYPLEYEEEITEAAREYKLDPYLVAAVIQAESGWNTDATSHRGARGLMQVMPETAQDMVRLGIVDVDAYDPDSLLDPKVNIEFGCAYLSYLLTYFHGATDKAIAAYNAGMGNVDEWARSDDVLHNAITFPETQAYLARVNMCKTRYQELYPNAFR